jgi:ABC-type transport system involved in cytochrome bd biosynthesis fused ATPase/permease subunit
MIITDSIPNKYLIYLSYLNIFEVQNLLIFFAILLISVFFLRLLLNIFYLWRLSGFLMSLKSYLSEKLIKSLFSLDYLEFKKRDVSSTTRLIIDEKNVVISNYFTAVLSLALEIITFIPYIVICILLDYKIFSFIAIFSLIFFFYNQKNLIS